MLVTFGTQEILTFRAPGGRQFRFVVMITDVATLCCCCCHVNVSVIMTTNLSWRPPGARNVRISCVPTVTGTMPDLHQPSNTLLFPWKITRKYPVVLYLLGTDAINMAISTNYTARFMTFLVALCA